jgi:septal ring factor EnvC (AmiA/AmiB activator)
MGMEKLLFANNAVVEPNADGGLDIQGIGLQMQGNICFDGVCLTKQGIQKVGQELADATLASIKTNKRMDGTEAEIAINNKALGTRVDAVDAELGTFGSHLAAFGTQLDNTNTQLITMGSKIGADDDLLTAYGSQLSSNNTRLTSLGTQLDAYGNQLTTLGSQLVTNDAKLNSQIGNEITSRQMVEDTLNNYMLTNDNTVYGLNTTGKRNSTNISSLAQKVGMELSA